MCNFINWHADQQGYVVQCEVCQSFQVSFGTTMLTLNNKQFQTLVRMVLQKNEELVPMHDLDTKCIVVPTHCREVHTILSEREFHFLHDMLQKVDTEIRSAELLRLFNVF